MSSKIIVSVFIISCVLNECLPKQIPEYITTCKRDQSTIDACIKSAVEKLRPKLINGIPELEVPPIEPFVIPEIRPHGELASINAYAKDVKVTGGGNFHIKSVAVDLNTFTIRVHLRLPKLHFEGHYKVDARLLVPIKGEGTLIADAVKCDAQVVMHSKVDERDGKEYLTFTKIDFDVNIKDYSLRLDGLFNGDKALGDATNAALNQNRGDFLRASKPFIERGMSRIFLATANNIVKDVSIDDLFPAA